MKWLYRKEWHVVIAPLAVPEVRLLTFWFGKPDLKPNEACLGPFASYEKAQAFIRWSFK